MTSGARDAAADVVVAGAGPAGAVAARVLAQAGCDVLLLDRARFPRPKVCGDCLNPSIWEVCRRQGLEERVRSLHLQTLQRVEFAGPNGSRVRVDLPGAEGADGECAVERRDFDLVLLEAAREAGVRIREGVTVERVERVRDTWIAECSGNFAVRAQAVIAADGRNSGTARSAGRLMAARRGRVAMQATVDLPRGYAGTVALWCFREGYAGLAHLGGARANLCLVGRPGDLPTLERRVAGRTAIAPGTLWRTIAPLDRCDSFPLAADGLFLAGDAARVVEPFTGEGTYYAMRTGELAGEAVAGWLCGRFSATEAGRMYIRQHAAVYRGRLWINRLARRAVLTPAIAETVVRVGRNWPRVLSALTAAIVRPPHVPAAA